MGAVLGRFSWRESAMSGGRPRSWLARAVALTLLVPTSYAVQSLGPGGSTGAAAAVPTPPPAAVNPLPSMKEVTTTGPTVVSGTLSKDTVWGPSGSPYVVSGLYKVGQDVSLTLLPGTVVKFQGQSARITVLGQILALGSPQDRVVFSSYKDDTVSGDTNGDGAASAPARGDWSGIDVYGNDTTSESTKRPVSVFDYVDVRYGGYGAGSGCAGFGAVKAASSHARMVVSNSSFTDALYAGVASGKVDADGFVGIYDSYFASSRCGVTSVQAGDTNGQTEVVGNTFAEDFDLAAAYFLNPRQTGFWFNTAHAPVIAAGSEYLEISISYNELLGGVQTWGAGYQQVYDLRSNWWGDNLNNRPLPGPCMTYADAAAYQPPVTTAADADCYADNGKVLVTGWERQVLPALSAPPADFLDAVAEPYAPRVGPVDTYRGRLTYRVDDLTIQDAGKAITDDDGNLASVDRPGTANDASYTYNAFGELVDTTVGAQTASYERDGLGRVIERTLAGATDTYGYDGQSTSITAFDAPAAPATSLVRTPGQDLISLVPTGGTPQKATTNLHGDLSALRNQSNGQFTYSALFEPFGTATKTGTTPVQLGFQAMPQDPVGGLVDMGFRSYDPTTARFTAADDRVGHLDRGITINRYQYGSAAPLDYFDPDGHDFFGISLNLNINLPSIGNLLDGIGDLLGGIRSLGNTIRGALASGGRALTTAVGSTISHIKSSVTSLQGNLITGAKSIAGSAKSAFNRTSALINQVSRADMSAIHTTLDIAGFVPFIGEAADLGNAVLYLIQGDTKNALISFAAMIPVLGSLAVGARTAGRASKFAHLANQPFDAARLTRFADNAAPAAASGVTRVFRVEGPGNARLRIDGGGNVRIKGDQTLFPNFGDEARAQQFRSKRLAQGFEGTYIKSFDVPNSYVEGLRARAVPESMARDSSVFQVDTNVTSGSFGLRSSEFEGLMCAVIPGSAC